MDNLSNSTNNSSASHSYYYKINIDNLNWFNISYYDGLSTLDRTSISNIINSRRHVFDMVKVDYLNTHSTFCYCLIHTYQIANNEKLSFLNHPKILEYSFAIMEELIKHTKKACPSDAYEDEESHKNDLETIFELFAGDIIRVNLSDNDDILIESFKNWLADKRKSRHSRRFSDTDFLKVKQYKVIPYIDLILWSKITGNKITNKQLAELLFPNNYSMDAEEMRKKVKKYADRLLYSDVNLI